MLAAVRTLPGLSRRRVSKYPLPAADVDEEVVAVAWRRAVYGNASLPADAVDRDAYVVCVLEQLHKALRVRDIFAAPSLRWADPRARLLAGREWEAMRGEVLTGLGLTAPAEAHLAAKATALDAACRQMAARLAEAGDGARLRVVPGRNGRMRLSVERLHALPEPPSLVDPRERTAAMLPLIDLPDLVLEVQAGPGSLTPTPSSCSAVWACWSGMSTASGTCPAACGPRIARSTRTIRRPAYRNGQLLLRQDSK